jgi:hypothetical protein
LRARKIRIRGLSDFVEGEAGETETKQKKNYT